MYGSGAVSCSCSLLIRGPNLARCQAEAPLIALCKFPKLLREDRADRRGENGAIWKAGRAARVKQEREPRPTPPRKELFQRVWPRMMIGLFFVLEVVSIDTVKVAIAQTVTWRRWPPPG